MSTPDTVRRDTRSPEQRERDLRAFVEDLGRTNGGDRVRTAADDELAARQR